MNVYDDNQNVHASSIQTSITNLIGCNPALSADQCLSSLLDDSIMTSQSKELIIEYLKDETVHSVLEITFADLFTAVWSVIMTHPDSIEIKKILSTEMADSECKCFTGRLSRLVNCLSTYDERVLITISDKEAIGNLCLLLRDKYEGQVLIDKFTAEMMNRGYTDTDIKDWLLYLE